MSARLAYRASAAPPVVVDGRRPARRLDLLLVLPGLLLLAALVLVPLGRVVQLSLLDASTSASRPFVGLDNYTSVLTSSTWWTAVGTGLVVAVSVVVVQLVLALLLATSLWHVSVLWKPARFLALLPAGLFAVVGAEAGRAAVDDGFIASWFHLGEAGPLQSLAGVVAGETWRTTGLVVVMLHWGLTRVPRNLLDSAAADGASPWQRWRRVVLPSLAPVLAAAVAFRALDAWRMLEGPLLVHERAQGATTPSVVVHETAFGALETGAAAAAAVVLVLLTLVLAGLLLGVMKLVTRR